MRKLILQTVNSRYFKQPVLFLVFLCISVAVYYSMIEDKIIFPDAKNYGYYAYTDNANGGSSEILEEQVSDSLILCRFQLKEGFQSPFAGLIVLAKGEKYIEAEGYNEINISISGINIDRVGIALYTPPPASINKNIDENALYHSYFTISEKHETYNIPISSLQFPEWWTDKHQLTDITENTLDLTKIIHININTAFAPEIDHEKVLKVYSIVFTRNNTKLFIFLGSLVLSAAIILFAVLLGIAYKKNKISEITVAYKPVEISKTEMGYETSVEYINQHYNNSELSLDIIAKETGIPPRRITALINEKFECNFKTYLNRIRIHESKRLLKETDLSIGEIAYKVGFNTQSHFNRVFKSEEGINPSDFRSTEN